MVLPMEYQTISKLPTVFDEFLVVTSFVAKLQKKIFKKGKDKKMRGVSGVESVSKGRQVTGGTEGIEKTARSSLTDGRGHKGVGVNCSFQDKVLGRSSGGFQGLEGDLL